MNDAAAGTKPEGKAKKAKRVPLTLPPAGGLPLPWWLAYSGAFLSGLLYWLAFAGWDVWPLSFVAFVPLIVSMHRQTPRRALLLGLIAGLTMNVFGFYWLEEMLSVFSGFPAPVCMLFVLVVCAYQGGRMALLGWLYARASARGWPASLVLLAAFVASELLYPLLFPWYYAGTVHQVPLLTQTAELGGPILVGVLLVAANIAVAEPLLARVEQRKLEPKKMLAYLAPLAAGVAFAVWRIGAIDDAVAAAEPVKVGIVQANMGLLEKRNNVEGGIDKHLRLTEQVRHDDIDFVVWSETSAVSSWLPAGLDILQKDPSGRPKWTTRTPLNIHRPLGVPAVFGAGLYTPCGGADETCCLGRVCAPGNECKDGRPSDRGLGVCSGQSPADPRAHDFVAFNTGLSVDAQGFITARYDKTYLLMFGEYLPFGETFPALYKMSPRSGRFAAGTDTNPLFIETSDGKGPHPISLLICYEDVLPGFTNKAVASADPELLINMTNDKWFGDSTEPWEHLALAKFRAIEHRRFLVRSTNSGVSAFVDPVGRVLAHTEVDKEQEMSHEVRWMKAHTVYESLRDYPWYAVSLAAVAFAFVKRPKKA